LNTHVWPVVWTGLDLDSFRGFGAGRFRRNDQHNGHAIEAAFDFGAHNIANSGAGIQRFRGHRTLWLFCPSSTPGPLIA
jgi:hypothetical protein